MASKVQLKRSSVASKVPLTTDLDYGELSINYTDGKQHYKTSTNTIDAFASISAVATLTNKTFDAAILTGTLTAGGSVGTAGQTLQSTGTGVAWVTGGSGSVTSVSMTVPTGLSISGSPITTSGTLALTLTTGYSIPTTASQTTWDTAYTDRNKWDGGATGLVAATGRTSLGATTLGSNLFTLTNVAAISFPRINADNTVSALNAATFRTAIGAGTSSTTGTVTSVGGTGTVSGLTLTGTVTSTGNLTLGGTLAVTPSNFASQTANTVLAAPTGVAGTPTFRTLVAADIPSLDASKLTSGTIDAARLPSYVDDVIEGANLAAFPATGETGKIYVALDTNKTYRWSGSAYVYITSGAVDSVGGYTGVVTASNLLTALLTVDGAASGLDADTLDGNHASAFYLATNPSGYTTNTGTVTSVAALTLGTTGTDVSSTVATGTTTPVITLNIPTASATNRGALSAADWTTFNSKTSNTGTVTSVGGTGTVSGLTLTGTVTTTGSLTLGGTLAVTASNFASQTANTLLIAPNGSAGVPTFRTLATADLPTTIQTGTYAPGILGSTSAAVTAAGTTQATATALTSDLNIVTTSTAGSGVVVPGATSGKYAVIVNRSANAINVYPASGHSFDGLAVNTAISLPANAFLEMYGSSASQWHSTYQAVTQGQFVIGNISGNAANITGTYGGTITSSQITTGLGFTPYNATNPSGYTTNTGTVTSVGGTGTVSGLTLTGTVTTSGSLTLGGTLAVTASNFASQTANTVLAAPDGAAGVPTFRNLLLSDMPSAWIKRACNAATTAALTLNTAQTVIDGVTLTATSRVLVKNQAAPAENGIYTNVTTTTWVRATDADVVGDITGAFVNVDAGTVNGGKVFDTDFKSTDTLGTTAMTWYQNVDTGMALTSGSTVVDGYVRYAGTTATAGQFDGGATTPTGTTRLNYGGYFYPSYINLVGSADTATAATHYFVETGTDGYVRPKTLANVKTEIVTTAAVNAAAATTTGIVTTGTWSGLFGAVTGANLTNLTAANLTGTINTTVLGNSTVYIGTTAVALNRASANQALTGISSVAFSDGTTQTTAATAGVSVALAMALA